MRCVIINKIKILSAVILALTTAVTVFSSCNKNDDPIIPDETVIGSQGELLGVSFYNEENQSETQTFLFEITTKKPKKTKKNPKGVSALKNETKNNPDDISGSSPAKTTEPQTENSIVETESESDDKKYESSDSTILKKEKTTSNKKQPTVPYVKKSEKNTKKQKQTTVKSTKPIETNKLPDKISDETIPEELNGLNIVYKTDIVEKGDDASIMVQGQPGKKYALKFYSDSSGTGFTELEEQTADENGFLTWTFRVPMNCESGNRKIIISDTKSSEHIQTSIKVK